MNSMSSHIVNGRTRTGALWSTGKILDLAKPIHVISGVYFLIKGDEIVYIGRSYDCVRRVTRHPRDWFDSYAVLECQDADKISRLEVQYIQKFSPRYNLSFRQPVRKFS